MELRCFKTLWGYAGSLSQAVEAAVKEGYDGIEGPVPRDLHERERLARALSERGLAYIAEVATTGSFVPNRRLTPQQHLDDLAGNLAVLAPLQPRFITCLGGCDAWPLADSIGFFRGAMMLAAEYEIPISFETHRGRSLYNPWTTAAVVDAIADIKLTFDISHWSVVCEGLQETEEALIGQLASNAHHIHARVGYDQGPQVADPRLGVYQQDLVQHSRLWQIIWESQLFRGYQQLTVTPEFGLDGYQYRNMSGEQTQVDVAELNQFMSHFLRNRFMVWRKNVGEAESSSQGN